MLRRLRYEESGISLVEVLVASAMASIIATAFLLVFSSFSRNVSLEEAKANALTEVQLATSELAAELRQAVALSDGLAVIEVLDSAWASAELVFHSDRAEAPGPERYRYFVANCTATHCDLMRAVTVADGASPPFTHTGPATTERVVANLLIDADPLFVGAEWGSGSEVLTTNCDTVTKCEFDLVTVVLRVDPDINIAGEEALHVRHDVRLRNAS